MSDTQLQPGYWLASDGKWYPPAPPTATLPPPPPPPPASGSAKRRWPWYTAGAVIVLIIVAAVAGGGAKKDKSSSATTTTAAGNTTVPAAGGAGEPATTAETTQTTAAHHATGTKDAPVPLGTPADVGNGWTVTITQFTSNANAEVAAANEFNDPAPAGQVYVIANETWAYNGSEQSDDVLSGGSLVGSQNVEYTSAFAVTANPLDTTKDVFKGGSISGEEVFTVPAAEVPSLELYASGGFANDDVFFALH